MHRFGHRCAAAAAAAAAADDDDIMSWSTCFSHVDVADGLALIWRHGICNHHVHTRCSVSDQRR